ncbi:unnamed protein product [Meganyctiphanes norvegica]|uniref:Uncharacterized protein n=1 Tax=Meganyctiphanes norvegica TaxID=48144 RepID=A0AAV2QV40_MEGNR
MLSLAVFATLSVLTAAQVTQIIDGTPTVVRLYASTPVAPSTATEVVYVTTGTVTHTCTQTVDEIMPMTATFIRHQYVTESFLEKKTHTTTISSFLGTVTNIGLVVTTVTEGGPGGDIVVTDTSTGHAVSTEVVDKVVTLTHTRNRIVFTTTTAWLEQTQTYSKMIVISTIVPSEVTLTLTKYVTDTRIVNPAISHGISFNF